MNPLTGALVLPLANPDFTVIDTVECGKEIHCHWITKAFGDTNYNIKNLFLLFHLLRIHLSIKPVS